MSGKSRKRTRSMTLFESENESNEKRPKCVFCKTNVKNKYYLGKMFRLEDIYAHYYCILFSPGLQQNGSQKEGIKGFLLEDIKKELRRGSHLSCSYCHKKGAVIGCAVNECNIKFHLTCGLINKSFHNFHDIQKSFPSLCCEHRPNQRTARIAKKSDDFCAICREEVDRRPSPITLWSPCCGHWFHRDCLQKQAYHSGKHHFKCSQCNDNRSFVDEMKNNGIYVPSRDASWERGDTFQELYESNYSCSAHKCLCRKNRKHNGDDEWEILTCDGCGSNPIHIKCANLKVGSEEWVCDDCKPILNKKVKKQKVLSEN